MYLNFEGSLHFLKIPINDPSGMKLLWEVNTSLKAVLQSLSSHTSVLFCPSYPLPLLIKCFRSGCSYGFICAVFALHVIKVILCGLGFMPKRLAKYFKIFFVAKFKKTLLTYHSSPSTSNEFLLHCNWCINDWGGKFQR